MLKVTYTKTEQIIPYARNARTHSDEQIAQVAASIREFGFTNPILIDPDKTVIAGHGRLLAAQRLGLDKVPTIVLADLTESQRRAYVIADNKLALNAGWDDDLLSMELLGVTESDIDVLLTGFLPEEISALAAQADAIDDGNTDPDDVPDVHVDAKSKTGDVWLLGRHRLMCGDSTSADDVDALLDGSSPHLMVTDPPYGVEYDANWRNEAYRFNGKKIGDRAIGKVENDDRADWSEAWALFPGDVVYVWHAAGEYSSIVCQSLISSGFEIRMQIIWAKNQLVIGRGHYHLKHEPCWYAVRKGATGSWNGDRKQTTLWEIDKPRKSETGHSTQKPVECMRKPIENNSKPGDAVYDPFSGSGTTVIAAEQTGRRCYAMEISPQYTDLAVRRWQDFTGKQATLESTGAPFGD